MILRAFQCVLLILFGGVGVSAAASEPDTLPLREFYQCDTSPNDGRRTECGYLTNWLDPNNRAAGTIRFPYQLHRAARTSATRGTVIFVNGGPGAFTLATPEMGEIWAQLLETDIFDWLWDYDVVLFEQRGMPGTRPALRCDSLPTFIEPGPDIPLGRKFEHMERVETYLESEDSWSRPGVDLDNHAACRNWLDQMGVSPEYYSSNHLVNDIHLLIEALEIEHPYLWGASYGTWAALTFISKYPGVLDGAILEAVFPPGIAERRSVGQAIDQLLNLGNERCSPGKSCGNTPQAKGAIVDLFDRYQDEPLVVDISVLEALPKRLRIDHLNIGDLIIASFYSAAGIQNLPDLLDQDPDALAKAAVLVENIQLIISMPVFMTVRCHDASFAKTRIQNLAELPEPLRQWAELSDSIYNDGCAIWRKQELGEVNRVLPVESDLPILMLSGALDFVAPPSMMFEQRKHLRNSWAYEIDGTGHAVSENPCARKLMRNFLRNPAADPADECLDP